MADNISSQYDFFKNVQLDADGNLLVSIVSGGGSTFTGGTINNLTVTGSTVLNTLSATSITAGTITSSSILWENKAQDNANGLIAAKGSNVNLSLDVVGSFAVGGISSSNPLSLSDVSNSAILAAIDSDIRNNADESIIISSEDVLVANAQNSLIASSTVVTLGEDTGAASGKRNSIISSSNVTIKTKNPSLYKVNNSSVIASSGITINPSSILERVVVLGMNNYTAQTAGVHVENLTITTGASADYVWTSVDSSGRGEWRINTSTPTYVQPGSNISTGGTANSPIVSVVASPSFNGLTLSGAATMTTVSSTLFSATTIYSGSTNLYSIFAKTTDIPNVPTTYNYDLIIAASDETTQITTGSSKVTFISPTDFTLTGVTAFVTTTGSTTTTIDVNYNGSTVFSTPISLSSGIYYGTTATTTSAISKYGKFTVDFDAAGTGAKGVKVSLEGYKSF